MEQFIPYFLGQAEPPFPRATSVQKCFRANDIENVGHTDRHLTFFEMLGNFSFGDYFKAESCAWGLELVTEGYGIDPERLWITVYQDDDEAIGDLAGPRHPAERIVAAGRPTTTGGPTRPGPAGPCSEIFVDRGPRFGPEGGPEVDEDRFMEIWNHVFMQDQVDAHADDRRRPSEEEHRHRLVARAGRDGAAGTSAASSRPICSRRCSMRSSRSRASTTAPTSGTTSRSGSSASTRGRRRSSSPTACSHRTRGAATSCGACSGGWSRTRASSGVQGEVLRPLVAVVVDGFGDAYPELVENRAFIEQVARLRGGAIQRHAAPGHGAVRGGARARRRTARSQATTRSSSRTRSGSRSSCTVELAADAGLDGRRGSVPRAARGAARPRARRREEGRDRARRRARAADRVRRLRAARGRGTDHAPARRRPRASSTSAEEGEEVLGLPRPHAVLRRGRVGRSATRARSGRRPARSACATRSGPGRPSIMHVGIGRVGRGPRRAGRDRGDRPDSGARRRPAPTPRPTSSTGP